MIHRSQAPDFKVLETLAPIPYKVHTLSNAVPVYSIQAGELQVLKIDFIFNAGEYYQHKPLVSSATLNLLSEGSSSFTAEECAEQLDFLGSYVYYNTSKQSSVISLYCLEKHAEQSVKIVHEMLKNPLFLQEKLDTYIAKKQQQYMIEREKVEVAAQKLFARTLFGTQHPYGKSAEPEDFLNLTRNDIVKYHSKNLQPNYCNILISGAFQEKHGVMLETYFGEQSWKQTPIVREYTAFAMQQSAEQKHYVERDNAVQTALRIGKPIINVHHRDYAALQVLNTILGGYFGSRLMSNIREDKGYTYGIGSGIVPYKASGCFVIASQVKKEVRSQAAEEVYKELARLRTELVPTEELHSVRNYMLATMARNFDGCFALSDSCKFLMEFELTNDYYQNYWNTIRCITAQELQRIANEYFQEDSLFEVCVG
ncbi:MAG: insulinase family protein [Bacteroidales bacterium]|jgi:predicted Zn-dependent peptidase|nr:insulinase family protein [Bacteroidales bacterium]